MPILSKLRALYVLHLSTSETSFFQCGMYSTAELSAMMEELQRVGVFIGSRSIFSMIENPILLPIQICRELAPFARILVDSFDIPDHLLGIIAGDWIAAYDFDRPNALEQL
jgi:hypothetical protein